MKPLSVRYRLLLALGLLAVSVLAIGALAWNVLSRGNDRLDRLHGETLTGVDQALTLSQQAADLATLAPYLLTLDSPFRIAQDGQSASRLVDALSQALSPDNPLQTGLADTRDAISDLVRETSLRAGLRDRTLRLNAELAIAERSYAALAARPDLTLAERQEAVALQRVAAALVGAGRAENLISIGEFQREYTLLTKGLVPVTMADDLARLKAFTDGREGLFEQRRLELARQIGAEAALVRIRQGAAAVTAYAAGVTDMAQATIAAEREDTTTAIAVAKSTLLAVVVASTVLALVAALYVSGYVTANLQAISEAMIRLASGDRQTRLPRGAGQGDEIGKLFHAFRAFRANALRLDRSHRQMAQRTALFEKMMAGMTDGVAILSDQRQIVAHNTRLSAIMRVDIEGLPPRPRIDEVIAAAGWQTAEGPAGLSSMSLPAGALIEIRESPLPDGGAVVLVADATERRQMEERLRQIQRIEALGKVSGEVAHDFGNILSTIAGSLHLMENAPPARQSSLRQTIASAVDLGSSLTGRLLAIARRQHLAPEIVDLPQLVEGMADLVTFAVHNGVELEILTGDDPLPVQVDPGQLESAILNLCLNASQAIAATGRVRLAVWQDEGQAAIEVADTGAGMPPDVLAHAMEPFFTARADGTGTGLGLAMVYGFIRQSGGDVAISSIPGKGTTVRLSLPIHRANAACADLGTVLLVEDNPSDRAAAMMALARMTQRLLVADDAEAARERLGDTVDLLVTDLSLHGRIEGWRLAETALTRWPHLRVVVVSGHLPHVDPLSSRFPGRVALLEKPVDPNAIASAVSQMPALFRQDDKSAIP